MESFATIVNGFQPLTIVAKLSILDVYGGPGYASVMRILIWGPPKMLVFNSSVLEPGKDQQIHWTLLEVVYETASLILTQYIEMRLLLFFFSYQ